MAWCYEYRWCLAVSGKMSVGMLVCEDVSRAGDADHGVDGQGRRHHHKGRVTPKPFAFV